jgi:MoaA/NifB/PqqE/SkfB family radical SAM enzyme
MERPYGDMDIKTFKLVADRCIEYGTKQLAFSGFGEPLLNKQVVSFVKYAKEKNPSIKIDITTNAALLNKKLAKQLIAAGLDEVRISFNGWDKSSYEKIMTGLNFEKTIKNIVDLNELADHAPPGFKVLIVPVMMKLNKENDLRKMRKMFERLGLTAIHFKGYYVCHNRSGYFRNEDIIDDKFYFERDIKLYPADKIACLIPFLYDWVDWRGLAHLCCNDIKDKAVLGDLREFSLAEIEEKKKEMIKRGENPLICKKCNLPLLLGEKKGYILRNN